MRITALAGGVGGARFLRGLLRHLAVNPSALPDDDGEAQLTIIGNTGDDITLFGLRVCPDLDTLLYTLGGGIDERQGWGRADETHSVAGELAALGAQPQWFGLGDKDIATHVHRSQLLGQGVPLSEVVARLAARWGLPEQGVTLLPMTDTPVETHVVVDDGEGGERAIHFQEWWVRHRAALPARRFVVAGLDRATPAPGVLDAVRGADVVLLPPSNPVVSIGIVLGVPGVRDALRGTRAPVVGVSPLVGGRPVRGHADECLRAIGVDSTSEAVAGLYSDFLDGWLVDEVDPMRDRPGLRLERRPLLMSSVDAAADLAGAALEVALDLRRHRATA
ncbi:LPPG:FO 2-phospho-L-lactate transferase [Terracoccus luteus]|uniref:LPPG:FO 2-phospho-L-lactate transferase n=1 Tax=Terracoccus luteus TaxID=53356 RepID=A0A495XZG7_9MICO|nr:2-phospho-L-lactate transferase [Terracoccus luteus]RKT78555.1 LPPG:FO 2-phospho-L-lactate transferase [Terracoccus luteus]